MFIYVNAHEIVNAAGRATYISPEVRVEHSPREGFDNTTLAKLENELQELITSRLNEALRKGDIDTDGETS